MGILELRKLEDVGRRQRSIMMINFIFLAVNWAYWQEAAKPGSCRNMEWNKFTSLQV